MSSDERQLYSLLLVVVFVLILSAGSGMGGPTASMLILASALGFIVYKLRSADPDSDSDPDSEAYDTDYDANDEDNLLDVFLTPEQKATFASNAPGAPGSIVIGGNAGGSDAHSGVAFVYPTGMANPVINPAGGGNPAPALKPKTEGPKDCKEELQDDPIFSQLADKPVGGHDAYLDSVRRRSKGIEPKKTDVSLIHKMGLLDVFDSAQNRHWWNANED